jgi:large subunit ribosomal protein L10
MPNLVNRLVVEEYRRTFDAAQGMVFVSMAGLSVAEVETIRCALADQGVELQMLRNSLAAHVLGQQGYSFADGFFVGNLALAHGSAEAAIHAAKIFASPEVKKAGKISFRGGVLDRSVLSAKEAEQLASVPDKNTLRARLIGCLQGPSRGLVGALNGLPGGLVRLINAHAEKAQGGAAESAAAPSPEQQPN